MSNNVFTLISNGFKYEDCWEKIEIKLSIENVCNEINLGTLNFFENLLQLFKASDDWNLKKGKPYTALINKEIISTGYVDEVEINYDSNGSNIDFYLRDKTSDLVDCCFFSEKISEFKNQKIINIINTLCLPFKINVIIDPVVTSLLNTIVPEYTIDQGRSVAELIVEECVKLGVLVTTDGLGNIILTQPNLYEVASDIITETNIISCRMNSSLKDRFSNYITKAEMKPDQLYNVDADQLWISKEKEGCYSNKRIVEDAELKERYRPLILLSDTAQTIEDCVRRSFYEANIRRAKGLTITYELEGWTEVNSGKVWKPNKLVLVVDKKIDVNELMLINSVSLSYDNGFKTTLELVRKECYGLTEQALQLIRKGF
jgi:prophage tail gpP-like protein